MRWHCRLIFLTPLRVIPKLWTPAKYIGAAYVGLMFTPMPAPSPPLNEDPCREFGVHMLEHALSDEGKDSACFRCATRRRDHMVSRQQFGCPLQGSWRRSLRLKNEDHPVDADELVHLLLLGHLFLQRAVPHAACVPCGGAARSQGRSSGLASAQRKPPKTPPRRVTHTPD